MHGWSRAAGKGSPLGVNAARANKADLGAGAVHEASRNAFQEAERPAGIGQLAGRMARYFSKC